MITLLHIKNIGIIEDIAIELFEGLNVLTGETGAGKTLIINSLAIISGGRFSKDMIRKGENHSFVELCLYEPNSDLAVEDNIIVSREIHQNGKNMCKINGRLVTVLELKQFMQSYIEIHGQRDNQKILNIKQHIRYLDGYIGKKVEILKKEYLEKYHRLHKIKRELKVNYGDEKERERKLDLLHYEVNEIEAAKLKEKEEEELLERRLKVINAEKIAENLNEAEQRIEEGAIDNILNSIKALEKIQKIDDTYSQLVSSLKSAYYDIQEISRDLSLSKKEIFFDEEEKNDLEERLDIIKDLKRKYGNSISEILRYKEKKSEEINFIKNLEENNNNLKLEKDSVCNKLDQIANLINKLRVNAGIKLSREINNELSELEMKNAKINVNIELGTEYYLDGKDNVKFMIKTNKGEDEKELTKIASGGEMSRIMLAMKKVLSKTDNVQTMIFDEIDTGISGIAANSVAKKLKSISKEHQVICISHLPNIASAADFNYLVSKETILERTKTNVKLLDSNEVINEIARISSGELNEATIKYAKELKEKNGK